MSVFYQKARRSQKGRMSRASEPQRQTCKACGQPDKFDFHVPDQVWCAVVPLALQNRVVCLYCFDEMARESNVEYAHHVSVLHFAGRRASFEFSVVRRASVSD